MNEKDIENAEGASLGYFEEVNKMYTCREAIDEAKRCLRCKVPQCRKGCPIENNIPDFIHELSKGNMGEAMAVLHEKTNLPAICGRVCPHEKQCEGHCVLGKKGNPVRVGKLESFIASFDYDMQLTHERIPEKTRGKVAVIGSGPAGLTVAGDLARQGFHVTIFEGIKKFQVHDHLYRNKARIYNYEDFRTYQLNSPYFSVTNSFCNIESTLDRRVRIGRRITHFTLSGK